MSSLWVGGELDQWATVFLVARAALPLQLYQLTRTKKVHRLHRNTHKMSRCFIIKPNLYTADWKRVFTAGTSNTKNCGMSTFDDKSPTNEDSENKDIKKIEDCDVIIPEAPTNCCMSGCANCVWIQYAEELTKLFKDGGKTSREIILQKVDDPNMKAFLLTELRALENKLEDTKT